MSTQNHKPKWFETDSPTLITVLLILFFPLGLWSMWKYGKWSTKTKWIVTGAIAAFVLLATAGTPDKKPQEAAQPETQSKTVVFSEELETPVGPLPLLKYSGDSCLYAKATTAHTNYYGMDKLKDELKSRYNVTCVLWE